MAYYTVNLIGSGNVATNLAAAFHKANTKITSIYSRNYKNAYKLAEETNSMAIDTLDKIPKADVSLICIKDDHIPEIIEQLSHSDSIIAHTAGSISIDIFGKHIKNYGVFYPIQTFNKEELIDFHNIPICIEANLEKTKQVLKNIASLISKEVLEINSEQRKHIHLSAVFVCNFVNYLYEIGHEITKEKSVNFDLLKPLIQRTAEKIQNNIPADVQTGPAVRNDEKTIKKHLELLSCHPKWGELYKLLSTSIINYHKKYNKKNG